MKLANQEIAKKRTLVQDLQVKYPNLQINPEVVIKCEATDVQRLVQLLLFDEKIEKAALKIQTFQRMRRARREFIKYMKRRIHAKDFIARTWRIVKFIRVHKKQMQQRREEATLLVQRYLRGYLGRNQAMSRFLLNRFNQNIAFFDEKRKEILTEFQIKLRQVWFAYKERKARPINERTALDNLAFLSKAILEHQ